MKPLLIIFLALLFSCEKNECATICTPTWIEGVTKTIIDNKYKGEIVKYRFQNQEVYLIRGCIECADYIDEVRNCEGKTICESGGIAGINTCPNFDKEAVKIETVWKN
jgi:hypothetical protein